MTMFSDVLDFHDKYGCTIGEVPHIPDFMEYKLRRRLILEEVNETIKAMDEKDLVGIADGLADSIYVLLGTAIAYGIDLEPIFAIVHASNMTKDGAIDAGGKITKGPNFVPPNIRKALDEQGAWVNRV